MSYKTLPDGATFEQDDQLSAVLNLREESIPYLYDDGHRARLTRPRFSRR